MAADGQMRDYTLVDLLSLPQPRTSHPELALKQLIEGHGENLDFSHADGPEQRLQKVAEVKRRCQPVDPATVDHINWWCDKISEAGRALRTDNNISNRRASLRAPL